MAYYSLPTTCQSECGKTINTLISNAKNYSPSLQTLHSLIHLSLIPHIFIFCTCEPIYHNQIFHTSISHVVIACTLFACVVQWDIINVKSACLHLFVILYLLIYQVVHHKHCWCVRQELKQADGKRQFILILKGIYDHIIHIIAIFHLSYFWHIPNSTNIIQECISLLLVSSSDDSQLFMLVESIFWYLGWQKQHEFVSTEINMSTYLEDRSI